MAAFDARRWAGREREWCGRTKRWLAATWRCWPADCLVVAPGVILVVFVARPPQDFSQGPPRRGASARAALRSCPKPHQLLDFLLQRDSKAVGPPAPSRRSVASRRPWPWTMRRSGDRRGFVRGRCDATAAGASAAWPALSANSSLMTKARLQKLQVDVHNTFLPRRSRMHYSYISIENYRQLYHLFAIFFCFAPCSIRQNDQT